jgi:hypothetical protein
MVQDSFRFSLSRPERPSAEEPIHGHVRSGYLVRVLDSDHLRAIRVDLRRMTSVQMRDVNQSRAHRTVRSHYLQNTIF